MRIFVTGGAGFIGSALVRHLVADTDHVVLAYDKLPHAGSLSTLALVANNPRYRFVQGDICDAEMVRAAIRDFEPDVIAHLAAERHVEHAIDRPGAFIHTNLFGTYTMLAEARAWWLSLDGRAKDRFRFHHISTAAVYGSRGGRGPLTEDSPYDPRSLHSASKAGSDHLVAAAGHAFGLPVLITHSSDNYGPYHGPDELIPQTIVRAIAGAPLPVCGADEDVRDWLYVEDHARALRRVFERGAPGSSYTIGGGSPASTLAVVQAVCATLDRFYPRHDGRRYAQQIVHTNYSAGDDDARSAIDASRIRDELGWQPRETLQTGIELTVGWYLDNRPWWREALTAQQAERQGSTAIRPPAHPA